MSIGFIDTSIVIDLLKGKADALRWSSTQSGFAVSTLVWMETVIGAKNRAEERAITKFLQDFEIVPLSESDHYWAMSQLTLHHLSDGVGLADCLIASVCQRMQRPLYTLNMKHFAPLLGVLAQRPF